MERSALNAFAADEIGVGDRLTLSSSGPPPEVNNRLMLSSSGIYGRRRPFDAFELRTAAKSKQPFDAFELRDIWA